MKIETVTRVNQNGQYEVLYAGNNRSEAKRIFKENRSKKNEFLYLFHQTSFRPGGSRVVGRGGFSVPKEDLKPATPKKPRKKKLEDSE